MYAMVDCNSFYASCERVFRPDLKNVPIAVLSNNDGCVIARSPECDELGLDMCTPTFKVEHFCRRNGIKIFSSNYPLYADISNRVMTTLEEMVPAIEIYSIDEVFLDVDSVKQYNSLSALGHESKQRVWQHVGMPVCVGIAPSKILSKLANYAAKQYKQTNGVVDLSDSAR